MVIYTIALIDPIALGHNTGALRRLAKVTGGLAFEPKSERRDWERVSDHCGRYPKPLHACLRAGGHIQRASEARAGRVCTTPDRKDVKVRTRTGYVAGSV